MHRFPVKILIGDHIFFTVFLHRDTTGAQGSVELIDITWGDFTVKNQAFSE